MTKGEVKILNHRKGMYAVEIEDGSYSVFELLDTNEINKEDVIVGPLDEEGGCTLSNVEIPEPLTTSLRNTKPLIP